LFQRFDLSLTAADLFFFWAVVLSAFSFPVAGCLSRRIGLINTMVFTHVPSSLCLIGAALAPTLPVALALLLAVLSEPEGAVRPASLRHRAASPPPPAGAAAALFTASFRALPLIFCGGCCWRSSHVKPPEGELSG